jgi:hypothetical protein
VGEGEKRLFALWERVLRKRLFVLQKRVPRKRLL